MGQRAFDFPREGETALCARRCFAGCGKPAGGTPPPVGPDSRRSPAEPQAALPAAAPATSAYLAAEQEYLRATEQLLAALEERQAELPPETAAVVDENLRIIDAAIAEVKQALDEDPADPKNGEYLTALHRQKIQLLWKASRLSS